MFFIYHILFLWLRFWDWLLQQPVRWKRLVLHFADFPHLFRKPGPHTWPGMGLSGPGFYRTTLWFGCLLGHISDILGIPDLYDGASAWLKWNMRPLTAAEKETARGIFGDSLDYGRIRIDERAWLGPRQRRFCYVSFYTVNSWGPMQPGLLIHELVHVWQYQQWGSAYIPLALSAQYSAGGYNYGGLPALQAARSLDRGFSVFNPEQQADIISDAFRYKNGLPMQWIKEPCPDDGIFDYFLGYLVQPTSGRNPCTADLRSAKS